MAETCRSPTRSAGTLRVAAIGDVHATPSAPGRWRDTFAEISAERRRALPVRRPHQPRHRAGGRGAGRGSARLPDPGPGRARQPRPSLRRAARRSSGSLLPGRREVPGGRGPRRSTASASPASRASAAASTAACWTRSASRAIKAFVQEALDEALRLEHALKTLDTERTVVVLHYAPVADTVAGRARGDLPVPRLLAPGRDHRPLRRRSAPSSTATPITAPMRAETRRGIPSSTSRRRCQSRTASPTRLIEV